MKLLVLALLIAVALSQQCVTPCRAGPYGTMGTEAEYSSADPFAFKISVNGSLDLGKYVKVTYTYIGEVSGAIPRVHSETNKVIVPVATSYIDVGQTLMFDYIAAAGRFNNSVDPSFFYGFIVNYLGKVNITQDSFSIPAPISRTLKMRSTTLSTLPGAYKMQFGEMGWHFNDPANNYLQLEAEIAAHGLENAFIFFNGDPQKQNPNQFQEQLHSLTVWIPGQFQQTYHIPQEFNVGNDTFANAEIYLSDCQNVGGVRSCKVHWDFKVSYFIANDLMFYDPVVEMEEPLVSVASSLSYAIAVVLLALVALLL